RSGAQPSIAPSSRPICAHSREWVSRVRGKSPDPARTICVLAASRRSAELCSTRARSRWNSERLALLFLAGSAAQRSLSAPAYPPTCRPTPPGAPPAAGYRGPSRFEAGDRDAERGAGHVVQADLVEEPDGLRVAAVLAADAEVDARPGLPACLDPHADQLA